MTEERRVAVVVSWCPQCGPEPRCDEDGCCAVCGCDVGEVPHDPSLLVEIDRLRSEVDRLTKREVEWAQLFPFGLVAMFCVLVAAMGAIFR